MAEPLTKYGKLAISLVMDIIGIASVFIPHGEFTDLIYAPIQASVIYWLYRDVAWALLALVEEALPIVTDVVPTATLAWFDTYVFKGKIIKALK